MLNKNNLAIEVLYQNPKTLKQEIELLLILTIPHSQTQLQSDSIKSTSKTHYFVVKEIEYSCTFTLTPWIWTMAQSPSTWGLNSYCNNIQKKKGD